MHFCVCGFLGFSIYMIIVSMHRNNFIFFITIQMSFTCLSCRVAFARSFCTMLNRSDESVYVGAHLQHLAGRLTIVLQALLSVFTEPDSWPDIHRSQGLFTSFLGIPMAFQIPRNMSELFKPLFPELLIFQPFFLGIWLLCCPSLFLPLT